MKSFLVVGAICWLAYTPIAFGIVVSFVKSNLDSPREIVCNIPSNATFSDFTRPSE